MFLIKKIPLLFFLAFGLQLNVIAQSLHHPHILVSDADKPIIKSNIEKYDWAKLMFEQLKKRQDKQLVAFFKNPKTVVARIPSIPGDRTKHRNILNDAAESAILYYLTGEEEYAQFSAANLNHYVKMISIQDPLKIDFFEPHRADNHHIMMREDFPRIAVTYDFIYPFLSKKGTTVFELDSNLRVPFDFKTAQKAFEIMAEAVLKQGGMDSNHPVLELSGGLYSALCIEDDAIRKSYYDRFWKGEWGQNGISWMLDHFTKEESMWPESVGYSRLTHNLIVKMMNVIDRYEPERKIVQNHLNIIEGIFIFENFKYPNGSTIAYGDLKRDDADNTYLYQNVLAISNRLGLKDYFVKSASTLKSIYNENGGYKPKIETEKLDWQNPLQLLWGVAIPDSISSNSPLYTTVTAKYAGVVMQRNYVEKDNLDYGLMYYTGGGTYVHAHASGLDMELYGAGYVIGPDYGSDTYGTSIHETYATNPAAHNTVIVNGTTHRAPKVKGKPTWIDIVDPIVLVGCEPKAYQNPIADYFSFSSQYLDDKINSAEQLRTNSIIRTSPTSGYYVDIFRSKSKIKNDFHDYLFHGLGDALNIKSKEKLLALKNTPERFQNDIGDVKKQPGWHWFSDTKTSLPVDETISARFDLNATNKYLHVSVPAGIDREYSSALAPPTKAVNNGYDKKKTQMFIMRKYGEAWDRPFVTIYEPSGNSLSTIRSTQLLEQNNSVVGVKVVSMVNGTEITDYILSTEKEDTEVILDKQKIKFKGRFGIVRSEVNGNDTQLTLYIGEGEKLSFGKKELLATKDKKGVSKFQIK